MNTFFNTLWTRFKSLTDLSGYIDVEAAAENIRANIRFRGPNVVILFCAIVIASVGLNVNSIPVIIGAMLISPLMSPIVGMGMALGTNDTGLLRASLKNLGIMVGISILASTLYFLVSPLDMEHPTELLARTNPTIYDVLIALFGGFAGILELSRKEKGTVIVGVAIATALMPPLCTVGYGLATWEVRYFLGALYLFFINLSFISLAAFIGTKYLGYHPVKAGDSKLHHRSRMIVGLFLVALIVPSVISGISVIRETNFTRSANAFVNANKSIGRSYIYDYKFHNETKPATIELFIAGEELSTDDYASLYAEADKCGIQHEQIVIRQDAAYRDRNLNENELIRDILNGNENKLQERARTIALLQEQVDSLQTLIRQNILPQDQIAAEVHIQHPDMTQIQLARTANDEMILVAAMPKKKALTVAEVQTLEQWLCIRLGVEKVQVIIRAQ